MKHSHTNDRRTAFTVVELLVVISILALLAAMTMSALANAAEQAKAQRTRAIIDKIDQLIMERWNGYRTRIVPVAYSSTATPAQRAATRLNAIRELQRMEMPDRITDVLQETTGAIETTASGITQSALARQHFRRAEAILDASLGGGNTDRSTISNRANWTTTYQGAECLYLIISSMRDGEQSALDYFTSDEIGDVDEDGMPEILDGWGNPIEFLRWAPGYTTQPGVDTEWGVANVDDDSDGTQDNASEAGWPGSDDVVVMTSQSPDAMKYPDEFDPFKADGSNHALKPLVYSAGPDGEYEVNVNVLTDKSKPADTQLRYTVTSPANDPYVSDVNTGYQIGMIGDLDSDGDHQWMDNITNHYRGSTN